MLYLTNNQLEYTIPIILEKHSLQQPTHAANDFTVESPTNIIIPGHTVQFIMGKLSSTCGNVTSVLVEPSTKVPTHMCLAHSLSPLTNSADVVLQVMNISPTPVTIYNSMKLATATPQNSVLLVSDVSVVVDESPTQPLLLSKIDLSHLTPEEQTELTTLLNDFSDVFSHDNTLTGHTSVVQHSILTTAPPIHQPLCRMPQALKSTVSDEVHRMLEHNIICPAAAHGPLQSSWYIKRMVTGDFALITIS